MRTLRISVRKLVEFLLRAGDIGSMNDWRGNVEAMQAGSEIHRKLQASGGESYQAEVFLAGSIFFPAGEFNPHAARLEIQEEAVSDQEGFFLRIEGRADGIIDNGVRPIAIDEIKGVSRDVSAIDEPAAVHEAQALCYAYLYLRNKRGPNAVASAFGEQVVVRLTYASMISGEVRQIERAYSMPDIEARFFSLLEMAQRWAVWRVRHDEQRGRGLSSLSFPLKVRDAQQKIMGAVASTIHEGGRIYVQAPTGSGKTIATLFPALKAMAAGEVSRIAFLTAKTMARRSALECLDLLRRQSTSANVLVMTARNKICPLRTSARDEELRVRPLASLCNPIECPLARGHYDSANNALYEAISTCDVLDRDCIKEVAARHHVCPYELQRDAARWADIIVCDYHYVFAPSASLLGLTDETGGGETVFLVDEAHNLVERMRDMYSAELAVADLKGLERLLGTDGTLAELAKAVCATIVAFPKWEKALPVGARSGSRERARRSNHKVIHFDEAFETSVATLADCIDTTLERLFPAADDSPADGRRSEAQSAGKAEVILALRDAALRIRALLGAMQRVDDGSGYVTFLGRSEGGGRRVKVYCVDPSHDLGERLEQAKAAVFFSGTLLPMDYHRELLAAQDDDVSIYAHSSFDPHNLQVLIATDVSARFSQRGPALYAQCASYLATLLRSHPGNYLVFLPSYAFLEEFAKALAPLASSNTEVVRQHSGMFEGERERFVARFLEARVPGRSLVGLCVLGGVFGESIDLPGETLVGVVVVGTGMPRASDEREVIRSHFDAKEGKGFAYAYTYPGMIKVLQAAGRLIRTEDDQGIVLLLDNRFLENELQKAFPLEWANVQTCTLATIGPKCLSS